MNSTPVELILRQSYLHLISYGLVVAILFVAIVDACLLSQLKRALRRDRNRLRQGGLDEEVLAGMVHPVARTLDTLAEVAKPARPVSPSTLRRKAELEEAALFVPLRARMALTRDLSTLMGLIATLLALVAAATDFARHGRPELLIGSVGTGCMATCVAAIGCAIALCNLSRLMRLRLTVARDNEEALLEVGDPGQPEPAVEVPIRHADLPPRRLLNHEPEENNASV